MYYPAIPLWSVLLIAAVAFALSKYFFKLEDQSRGHHTWIPVAAGVSRLVSVVFAIIALIRGFEMLRR